ncbi:MAG: radical SAM protein [Methanomicrobiales archaeon]|nr:radical SAM protein [Methanomicrobiales archaeon]
MALMDERIKAELLSIGIIDVEASLLPAWRTSTAGPGMGLQSIFFRSGGLRVRLEVNRDSPFRLARKGDHVAVLKGDVEIAEGMLEEVVAHCPEQVYITISERCIYNCQFCSVPLSRGRIKSRDEIVAIVERARSEGRLKAIALTSGIAVSPEDEIDRVVEIVRALSVYGVPIGVAVHPAKGSSRRLKDAGATEVKYSVETMDPEIFDRMCRGKKGHDLDFILKSLREAVEIFGKNHVSSNIIIGLGESDECVQKGVVYLAKMGVIPVLRPISIPPGRIEALKGAERPSPERLLKLTEMTRKILRKYDLRTDESKTMCLACTGCDLTP